MRKVALIFCLSCLFLVQPVFSAGVSYPPLIAVGGSNNGKDPGFINEPLITVSQDNGVTWASQGLPQYSGLLSYLYASACGSGIGSAAICVVGGSYSIGGPPKPITQSPLLGFSTNGGNQWTAQDFSQYKNNVFYAASCTGAGSATTCVVVGGSESATANLSPVLIDYSTNGAATWTLASVGNEQATLLSVSCSGSGPMAICVATGQDGVNDRPLTAYSSNGGASWTFQDLTGIGSLQGTLQSVSCAASNPNVCVAAGSTGPANNSQALLASSVDGGRTWQSQILAGKDQSFAAVSCAQSNTTTACVASGASGQSSHPLMAYSTYNGTTWMPWTPSVANIPVSAYFGVSCTTNMSSAVVCVLSGGGSGNVSKPLVANAIYANGVWTLSPSELLTINLGSFAAVNCVNNSAAGILCFTAGFYAPSTMPLLMTNLYNTSWSGWTMAKLMSLPYPLGSFTAIGAGALSFSGSFSRKKK